MTLSGKRVLICEDEGIIQMQLQRILSRAGLEVVGTAATGEEAIGIALRERPELVIVDINVPSINGLEAARQILAEYKPCVVVLTAYTDPEHKKEAWQEDICAYITKPITKDLLQTQLEQAWEAYSFQAP